MIQGRKKADAVWLLVACHTVEGRSHTSMASKSFCVVKDMIQTLLPLEYHEGGGLFVGCSEHPVAYSSEFIRNHFFFGL